MTNTGRRYTQEEIAAILKEAGAHDAKVSEVLRRYGVAAKTYYRWKARRGSVMVSEVSRIRHLEAENLQLKRIVADQTLNIQILKDLMGKA
jgi:putative transposase